MTRKIRIEQGINRMNDSWESLVRIEKGKINSAKGILGLTQFEDEVVFLIENHECFKLPRFLWMHYFAIILEMEGDNDTILVFEDGNEKKSIKLGEIGDKPQSVKINDGNSFDIYNYKGDALTGSFIVTPNNVVSGSNQSFNIIYTVGENGLSEGSHVFFITPFSNWSKPLINAFEQIKVVSKNRVEIFSDLSPLYFSHRGYVYKILVEKGNLIFGDTISIKYTNDVDMGIYVQQYTQEDLYFLGMEDNTGNCIYNSIPLSKSGKINVIAGKPNRFRIKTTQILELGEILTFHIRALDNCLNPVQNYCEAAVLEIHNSVGRLVYKNELRFNDSICIKDCNILQEGIYIVSVKKEGFEQENICVLISSEKSDGLYFGEIHGHSNVSDGTFGMQDYFDYGKNIGMLDFCALSDHDWEIVEHSRNKENGSLKALGELTGKLNIDNEFVTICGYEWMGEGGHINAYYLKDKDNPVYVGSISLLGNGDLYPKMEEFIKQYEGRDDVLIIPHFSHGFEYKYYDKRLQPVAEIYSQWGCSEDKSATNNTKGAIQFLADGLRFGFISGADSHHGMPGQTGFCSKYSMLDHREGLTGAYSESLTRQDIFKSFKIRKTYATTGERILLNFKLNGFAMGSEISLKETDKIEASIMIGGTRQIDKVEIISGGKIIWENCNYGKMIADFKVDLPRHRNKNEYYYLKVTQSDKNIAWSSPFWVDEIQ
jgi:hypothetical protein